MPRHEDDDIDVVEGLSASRDDVAPGPERRPASAQQTAAKPANQSTTANDPATHVTYHTANKRGAGFKWLVALLLLVLIAACGWLGQQVLQLQQHLKNNNNALQLERSRMESISAQVHQTGSSFEETGNVLESKFTFFESEIRKLWDVSNKRNKKDIASNTAQMKSLAASLKKSQQELHNEVKSLTSEQAKASQSLAKLNKQLASENTALRASLEEQSEQLLIARGELKALQQRLKNLPSDLSQRVAENEEAVQSIDASRKHLLSRMTQLQQRVDQLSVTAP